jgi:hypothetical protein
MKHIKNFKIFESVIMPSKIEDGSTVNSFESAVEFGKRNDFDVVDYDEFYNSLSEKNKKTAPPRVGVPFFALFNPVRKKAMFVLSDPNAPRFIPNFKEIMLDIIGHERVHQEQSLRKGTIDYELPNPLDKKAYFSNKEEVMAFSFTIATELSKISRSKESGMKNLEGISGQVGRIWNDIQKYCDEKTIKRYRKYIYMYLEKMFDVDYIKPKVSPFKKFDGEVKSGGMGSVVSSQPGALPGQTGTTGSGDVSSKMDRLVNWKSDGKKYKYETPEDLEKIGFKKMSREDRVKIIQDVLDNSTNPSKFMGYFSQEDIESVKKANNYKR